MRVIVVNFNYQKETDILAFSDPDYLIAGLIDYVKNGENSISKAMKEYFENWQKENEMPWEWMFQDAKKYWIFNSLVQLLEPFGCRIYPLIIDQGLC